MLKGDFVTPGRHDVDNEFDELAIHLDEERVHQGFDEFLDLAAEKGFSFEAAASVLKQCGGDFTQAEVIVMRDTDPAVLGWQQSIGASALKGIEQQNTFQL